MKRKRGRKVGKKSKSKTSTMDASPKSPSSPSTGDASPSSPSTDENGISPAHQADSAPPPPPEPTPPEPQKPAAPPANPADVQDAKPKVYSRVRLKFKSAKVSETHQNSSEAKPPADASGVKPASAAPEASKQVVVEKTTVSPDGQKDVQASEPSGSDKDKVARKVASIKIKSAGSSSVQQDKNHDTKADSVGEPLPSKQETVLENGESQTALEPRSSQELDVKQVTPERQRDDNELTAALEAIKKVMKMDAAEPFNTPVDPVALGIPDYFDVIDTPMDFGTICQNLERGDKYMNSEDVYKDVQFIWDNCTKYNSKGDYIIELMKRVKKGFMKNWLAAGLYSDVQENGGNDNTGDEDTKGNSKAKSKQKQRRLGNDRHKNDCACAVCQVTRRKKEKDEILAVIENETAEMNTSISDQQIMEIDLGITNAGSHDTTSSQELPTDMYKRTAVADDSRIQIENRVKFYNNQSLPPDYEDEGSRQYFEEKEEVDYTDLTSQEENTSSQPNDISEVAQHQHKEPKETSQEIEMEDYPMQQENHSFLQLCARLFPSNHTCVFRASHSLFRQQKRQVSVKESPLHAAITAIMKR
uniref:Bromo domain-containing protein n=1 Tax=Leersia perrieri TaxID=77586 RepID=A0A0D9X3N1_9ORYZ